MKKSIIWILLVILVAGVSFWCGTIYQKSQAHTTLAGQFSGRLGRTGSGGGVTAGQIISTDANGITIQLQNGSSQIVLVSNRTQINKMTSGALKDLSVGTNVIVTGTANSDGSLTAQSVQIRPAGFIPPTGSAVTSP